MFFASRKQCVIGSHKFTCQTPSKSIEWDHKYDSDGQRTDRQTDHDTEKCVAVGGIAETDVA